MKKLLKWGLGLFVSILFLATIIVAGIYFIFSNSVFPASGTANLAGISQRSTVVRDGNGVPHIEVSNRKDGLQLLGYMHAADRLWQMEVLRMAGQGRLSEMFGEPTIKSDIFLRTIDLVSPAKASVRTINEEARNLLQSYADGVNAYINRKRSMFEPKLAPEFMILGHEPEKWEAWHSIAILKVMALTLDKNIDNEIGRLALASKGFAPQVIDEIFTYNDRDTPVPLPDLRRIYGYGDGGKPVLTSDTSGGFKQKDVTDAELVWPIDISASNNWVISGSRTNTGKPMLANDPHLGFTAPSAFYLAHLRYGEKGNKKNIIGGTLPGTPLFLAGRNDHLAWGLTTTNLDAQDLYIEQINPINSNEYRTEDGYEPFEMSDLVIKVKDGKDINLKRRATRNGPVLPSDYKRLADRLPHKTVAALRWTALDMDDATFEGVLNITTASSVAEFFEATRKVYSPMQSIVVADVDGNTGLIAPGRAPMRSEENRIMGRAPVPGWLPQYRWQGYLPFEELPQILNPPNGALATANSNWLPATYEKHITYDWGEDFRQKRAERLYVAGNNVQDLESVKAGMADMHSEALIKFRDLAVDQLPQGVRIDESIVETLRSWDGNMDRKKAEPLILTSWWRHVNELMFRDDLGEDFDLVESGKITRILKILDSRTARNWCNKQRTPKAETCSDILFEALDLTIVELTGAFGPEWRKWRWGTAHLSLHEHRPFTSVDALSKYFTIRREISGGNYTLLRSKFDFSKNEPYAAIHGAAYRAAYDLSDLDKSQFIISTGVSGNVMSKDYDSLADEWADLEYVSMSVKPEDYQQGAAGTFVFLPAE